MSKVSVAEMLPVLGALRRDNGPAVRVQLRGSEGVDELPASLARQSPDIDPWKGDRRFAHDAHRPKAGWIIIIQFCEIVSRSSLKRRRPRKMGACKS